jgi:acyl dehydratase
MSQDRERLAAYATTAKQRAFEWDFTAGVDRYEVWDEIEIGRSEPAQHRFLIAEEDVLAFNRAALETDPLLVDPDHAARHGGLQAHPLFLVQIAFYCIGTGIGSWIRSPGARNPGQDIELFAPFRVGEEITATVTHWDKWIRRGHHYMQDLVEFHNQDGERKARWFATLLLPGNRDELARFASM